MKGWYTESLGSLMPRREGQAYQEQERKRQGYSRQGKLTGGGRYTNSIHLCSVLEFAKHFTPIISLAPIA